MPPYSGVIGSGLCVFSKFPILDTLLYQYSLNGYPYMVSGVGRAHGIHRVLLSCARLCLPPSPLAAAPWRLVLRQVCGSRRCQDCRDHLQHLCHPREYLRETGGCTPPLLSPLWGHC